MAIPNSPLEGDGDKLLFLVWDDGGTNEAALFAGAFVSTVNGENYGELKAYGTSGLCENGARTTASGSAIALSSSSIPCQGVLVQADAANGGSIFVGKSDVTTDLTDATAGWELPAGASVGVPCRNVNEVFIRASGSGFAARWIASKDG